MDAATTSKANHHEVYLETLPKKKRGKPKQDPINVIRRLGGGKKAFKDLKFNDAKKLYELWLGYFDSVLEEMHGKLDARVLKLDYHGCILRVSAADNPSMVGLNGIVLYESKQTFQMLDRRDRLIGRSTYKVLTFNVVIPKEGSTFQFVFKKKVYTIFGDALRQKSCLRGKKVKQRLTLPFFLK